MEPPPAPLDDAATAKQKPSILVWFAAHPIVGFVGTVASVIGVVLAVVLYLAAIRTRELSLYVNPSKTNIVKSGQSSDLHVLYRGKDVSTDVTALQVELWNAGKESIRPEHVLSPIILETSPKVPILEARIRHTSRPITQTVLDTSNIADGKVTVSWKILEHNDAAIIQFILAGPPETSIRASGALEGQARVRDIQQLAITEHWWFRLVLLIVFYAVPVGTVQFATIRWLPKHSSKSNYKSSLATAPLNVPTFLAIVLFGALFVVGYNHYFGTPSMPLPFN
jgi:hypothetical protein